VDSDIREQVMNGLIDKNPIDIPQALVHEEMHSMQHEAMQRMGIEDHDQAPPMENFREAAEKRVRLGLLLRQVISEHGIAADNDDLKARVEDMCAGYENADEMVKMYMGNPQVMQQIEPLVVEQKAVDWLVENGKAKAKKVTFKDFMNPPNS
jgi:trigger factor